MVYILSVRLTVPSELQASINSASLGVAQLASDSAPTRIIKELSSWIGPCTFVIDGIDAMPEQGILAFLAFLRGLCDPTDRPSCDQKVIMFCRETLGRRIRLEEIPHSKVLTMDIGHVRRDIEIYVDHEVDAKQQEQRITENDDIINQVKMTLKQNSEKM